MKATDIRQTFLRFFESKGHTIVSVPQRLEPGIPRVLGALGRICGRISELLFLPHLKREFTRNPRTAQAVNDVFEDPCDTLCIMLPSSRVHHIKLYVLSLSSALHHFPNPQLSFISLNN